MKAEFWSTTTLATSVTNGLPNLRVIRRVTSRMHSGHISSSSTPILDRLSHSTPFFVCCSTGGRVQIARSGPWKSCEKSLSREEQPHLHTIPLMWACSSRSSMELPSGCEVLLDLLEKAPEMAPKMFRFNPAYTTASDH